MIQSNEVPPIATRAPSVTTVPADVAATKTEGCEKEGSGADGDEIVKQAADPSEVEETGE